MKITSVEIKDILEIGALGAKLEKENKIDFSNLDYSLENAIQGNWYQWIAYLANTNDGTIEYGELVEGYWKPVLVKQFGDSGKTLKLFELREKFEFQWNNGGSFLRGICESLTRADTENLINLHRAFPELTEGYISYSQGKTWDEFIGA